MDIYPKVKKGEVMTQAKAIQKMLMLFGAKSGSARKPLKESESISIHKRILAGLPVEVFNLAKKAFKLTDTDLAMIIGVSDKTMQRRLSSNKPLSYIESDRFYRGIHIFLFALEVFRNVDTAKDWMGARQPALGGYIPIDFLKTEVGAKEVYDLLGRIEYGVYS